jgi:quinol monooxygenase YgiN|tara:strand:+ start:204 stop:509 length:306 start_codon:yes stop_codon:yes gene_type:complete
MINVLASISVKEGKRADFIAAFKDNLAAVRAEEGCIEYFPAVDIDADLPPQQLDENEVTVIEKWASLEALRAHLSAPHMLAYKEKVKDIVEGVSLKVLQEA